MNTDGTRQRVSVKKFKDWLGAEPSDDAARQRYRALKSEAREWLATRAAEHLRIGDNALWFEFPSPYREQPPEMHSGQRGFVRPLDDDELKMRRAEQRQREELMRKRRRNDPVIPDGCAASGEPRVKPYVHRKGR